MAYPIASPVPTMDVEKIRQDFPILKRHVNGRPLIYFDNAATSQKPQSVIEAVVEFYQNHNANVHRGVHTLSIEATELVEAARERVQKFIRARHKEEIIFVRNATEGINLVAYAWAGRQLGRDELILVTETEHHSNIVPWQLMREKIAGLEFVKVTSGGVLDMEDWQEKLSRGKKVGLVSLIHASNVLGTINPIKQIVQLVRQTQPEALILLDAAQSIPHLPVDVQLLDVDFLVFSGHKMLGPTGIGVLFGRKEVLSKMEPFLSGGDMIGEVYLDHSTWNELPFKFEAGTPNMAGAVGLGAAIDYLNKVGLASIQKHEQELTAYALQRLTDPCLGLLDKGLRILGPLEATKRVGLLAFCFDHFHAHDLASLLDQDGIAIRSGHHCAMPLHTKLGIQASARVSFYLYNNKTEIDQMIESLQKAVQILG